MITTSLVPRPSLWKGLGTRLDYYYIVNFFMASTTTLNVGTPTVEAGKLF